MKIGFFDSGLGGITVLNEALSQKIHGHFLYLADNKNTPYGIKDKSKVKKYIFENIEYLVNNECKIIVIACNTATALCIKDLRKMYSNICFIGTEPAVKVAVDDEKNKKIIVAATTITLKEEKLKNLITNLHITDKVDLLPLDKLVEFAEENVRGNIVDEYLKEKLCSYKLSEYSHIVLGCTHFPIFKENIQRIVPNLKVVDGSKGIISNLTKKIKNLGYDLENLRIDLVLTKKDNSFVHNFNNLCNVEESEVKYIYSN